MKKRTLFIIILSFIFIVTGGIGTVVTQGKLNTERENNAVSKKILTKENKELAVSFTAPTRVTIERSEDNHIYMDKEGTDFKLDKTKQADCTFTEAKDVSTLTINNPTTNDKTPYPFFLFSVNHYIDDTVRLRIPAHYDTLTINGNLVDLSMYDISMNTIKFNISNGSISLINIKANHVTQEKNNTSFMLEESKIQEDLSITSLQQDITILNTTAKLMTIKTDMGAIFTGNTKGELAISSEDGDISINHTTGKSTIETIHGDILFHDDAIDFDTTLTTTNGDIDIETDTQSIDNNQLDFETNLGEISIFNKNLSSDRKYKTTKGKISIKATSKNGDIEVEELDSEDTHYGYD